MSYYFDEYHILPSSSNGDKIVARDFKDKTVIFRVEIVSLTDQDFYRDGENSGYDTTFETNMHIITKNGDDYIFHSYFGGIVEIFQRFSINLIDRYATYNYDESRVNPFSSLDAKKDSYDFINLLYYLNSIAQISKIEPLIKSIKTLLNRQKRLENNKRKAADKAHKKYLKSKEYYQSNFGDVLVQLKRVTHCPFPNCNQFELNFNKMKNDTDSYSYFNQSRNSLCKECYQKGYWSI